MEMVLASLQRLRGRWMLIIENIPNKTNIQLIRN